MKLDSHYFSSIISRNGSKELLENFTDHKLANYKSKRNFDYGSYEKNFVSALSPALSRRIITEKEVIKHVSSQFSFGQIEKFVDEICWRTYWKGWLEHRPAVWYDYLSQLESFEDVKVNNPLYINSIEGSTGLECFDSWVKDLLEFGYLHNHSRMWFASIWIFYFNLPWQLGAEFFYQNLIDADPASNTLSWRWVAGLQTQGKKYITYKENIDRFTDGRFSFPDNFVLSDRMTDNYVYYEPNYQVLE
ncbi:MAG: FAD-binding domain-containing protein, partial [bacterium]